MKTTREVKREEHNERPQWKCDLAILMGKLVGRRDVEFDLPLEQFIEHLLEKAGEDLEKAVDTLILEIGKQVTRDYQVKGGIWEGMSISNVKSRKKFLDTLKNSKEKNET